MATFDGVTVTSDTLTDAECMALAVNGRLREVFGVNEDGTFTPDLERVRAWAIDAVNDWAGQQRRQHFTDITAQDSVYADKEAEARRCLADANPTADNYPYTEIERLIIEAQAGQPVDLHTAAVFIVQVADEKRALSVAIEAKRRTAGAQVAAAQTIEAIKAVLAGLE